MSTLSVHAKKKVIYSKSEIRHGKKKKKLKMVCTSSRRLCRALFLAQHATQPRDLL